MLDVLTELVAELTGLRVPFCGVNCCVRFISMPIGILVYKVEFG